MTLSVEEKIAADNAAVAHTIRQLKEEEGPNDVCGASAECTMSEFTDLHLRCGIPRHQHLAVHRAIKIMGDVTATFQWVGNYEESK